MDYKDEYLFFSEETISEKIDPFIEHSLHIQETILKSKYISLKDVIQIISKEKNLSVSEASKFLSLMLKQQKQSITLYDLENYDPIFDFLPPKTVNEECLSDCLKKLYKENTLEEEIPF